MTLQEMGLNFAGHFVGGLALSLTDRHYSENARRNADTRIAKKLGQAEALEYLVQHSEETSSQDYLKNVMTAREYFRSYGETVTTQNTSRTERLTERLGRLKPYERLNTLSARAQLGTAFGIELVGDGIVTASSIATGVGNPINALLYTPAQAAGLFLGLQFGKGMLKTKDYIRRSKEETEVNNILKQLTKDGKLLEVVRTYSATANLELAKSPEQNEMKKDLSAGEIGAAIGEKAGKATVGVTSAIGTGIESIRQGLIDKRRSKEQAAQKKLDDAKAKRKQELDDFEKNVLGRK